MPFQVKGLLAILILVALIALVVWAPWSEREEVGMPDDVFGDFEGVWEAKFSSYSIGGAARESYRQHITLESISPDSQQGEVVTFSPEGDTLSRDSVFHIRHGDSLYFLRIEEGGGRDLDRGYWVDGQFVWRRQDIFGRVAHAYREWVRKGIWEQNGFERTDRGDYLLMYRRAVRR